MPGPVMQRRACFRGQAPSLVHGSVQVERHFSKSCEWMEPAIRFTGSGRLNAEMGQSRRGCNGERASGFPLPRCVVGTTTHILRARARK